MIIGVPKEIKTDEYRVGIVPSGVEVLTRNGHQVLIETRAGMGSGITDEEYAEVGAKIVDNAAAVYGQADMIYKVKEPIAPEYPLMRPGQVVFTYFHFAASRELTQACLDRKIVAIAYETIRNPHDGSHPCLTPMSEVAGRMSIQEGAKCLERPMEGRGVLLGGIPGVAPGNVMIIGGGIVGTNAAKVAAGLGTQVFLLDVNLDRLRYLSDIMPPNVVTLMSNRHNILTRLPQMDLVVGAVLIEGAKAPVLVARNDLKLMKPGAVIVDVAIDQGGCMETSKATTHSNPTYIVEGVVHYCVANMPGAVGRTSTLGLSNVTTPYALRLANKGWKKAVADEPGLAHGVNMVSGKVTNQAVAETFGMKYVPLASV